MLCIEVNEKLNYLPFTQNMMVLDHLVFARRFLDSKHYIKYVKKSLENLMYMKKYTVDLYRLT